MNDTDGMPCVPTVNLAEDDLTLAGYLRKVKEATQGVSAEHLIYRGHGKKSWILGPELLRNPTDPAEKLEGLEATLREHRMFEDFSRHLFAYRPELVTGGDPDRDKILQWRIMSLARHFGLPTRFIDFTTNSLVALFFAVEKHQCCDGMVCIVRSKRRLKVCEVAKGAGLTEVSSPLGLSCLVLMSKELGYREENKKKIEGLCSLITSRTNECFDDLFAQTPSQRKLYDVAFVPEPVDTRVTAQGSLFLYEMSHRRPRLWELINEQQNFRKIRIPKAAKACLRKELSLIGINRASLFPGLEGAASHLKWWVYKLGNTSAEAM